MKRFGVRRPAKEVEGLDSISQAVQVQYGSQKNKSCSFVVIFGLPNQVKLDTLALNILLQHAFSTKKNLQILDPESGERIESVLKAYAGLPLTLSIAGSASRQRQSCCANDTSVAIRRY